MTCTRCPSVFHLVTDFSYTSFAYSNLTIEEENDTVKVGFDLTNTGKVAGKEVAQVYVANQVSRVEMPVKELRDFTKIALEPGESKHVTLILPRRICLLQRCQAAVGS